ncbi:Gfo/Idh/MocA family protein [Candidatus Nitrosotenuis cloacae]|uniref:Gfo/Idh/MocA family protein n=1 Tax=Candidatus Nitrosotenuis cloacae TaxID=1603555 RepID=UPI001F16207F|nr:Gfo/Idh/MocA family oxidoreductase [Candidatus Nitrosotenuis cloacae]
MKILVVGYGSIGKRHVNNLMKLKNVEILVCSKNKDTDQLKKNGIQVYDSLAKCLDEKPDIGFVCNVTSLHVKTAIKLAQSGCHLFIEKPLSNSLADINRLITLIRKKKLITMVGCNLRFHKCIQGIKKEIQNNEIGRIISVRVESGSYLPNWHPWEDYRTSYASLKKLGGGVVLTCIHEIDYLCWFFGNVDQVFSFTGKFSDLEISVEDLSAILLKFKKNIIAEVHLDYFQQPDFRSCKVIGTKGTIYWDSETNEVHLYDTDKRKWIRKIKLKNYERNEMYIQELSYFINCVRNKKTTMNTVNDALKTLQVAFATKKSSSLNKIMKL